MGELARASPRARDRGVSDAGGWLRDVVVPGARHRGLVVTCRPSRPRWHRDASGAGPGASQRAASPLQRGPGQAGAVARVSRPQCLAQQCAERGVANPRDSCVVDFPGTRSFCWILEFLPPSSLPRSCFFRLNFSLALSAGGRSWRVEPGRSTAASTD
jgi:hypothetical protein